MTLERDGETLLQFAAVYGFRNIQTLVQRIRKGRVPYQLVEVLSCPGGQDRLETLLNHNQQEAFKRMKNTMKPKGLFPSRSLRWTTMELVQTSSEPYVYRRMYSQGRRVSNQIKLYLYSDFRENLQCRVPNGTIQLKNILFFLWIDRMLNRYVLRIILKGVHS